VGLYRFEKTRKNLTLIIHELGLSVQQAREIFLKAELTGKFKPERWDRYLLHLAWYCKKNDIKINTNQMQITADQMTRMNPCPICGGRRWPKSQVPGLFAWNCENDAQGQERHSVQHYFQEVIRPALERIAENRRKYFGEEKDND
jgi:hypothetical protein